MYMYICNYRYRYREWLCTGIPSSQAFLGKGDEQGPAGYLKQLLVRVCSQMGDRLAVSTNWCVLSVGVLLMTIRALLLGSVVGHFWKPAVGNLDWFVLHGFVPKGTTTNRLWLAF